MSRRSALLLLPLSLLLAFAASNASADEPAASADYARVGAYVGLSATFGFNLDLGEDLEALLPGTDIDVGYPIGFNARVGYRLTRHIAVEQGFEYLPDASIEINDNDIGDLETWAFTTNLKGYPWTGRIQPFGLVGLGLARASLGIDRGAGSGETDFAVRIGGGCDIYLNEHIVGVIDVSYLLPRRELTRLDYVALGLGLQYNF